MVDIIREYYITYFINGSTHVLNEFEILYFAGRIIGMGAPGGRGSGQTSGTLGAVVRAVVELQKGQQLYFIIGQPGTSACPKVKFSIIATSKCTSSD